MKEWSTSKSSKGPDLLRVKKVEGPEEEEEVVVVALVELKSAPQLGPEEEMTQSRYYYSSLAG
jgi:hypothetical protein